MQTLMPTTDLTGPEAASASASAPEFALLAATGWDDSGVVTPVSSFSPEVSIEVLSGILDRMRDES
jgi:hypothetical protein